MPNYILKSPLVLQQGTGFTISDTSELFVKERTTITLSIPQSVASSSVVEFNQLTSTATVIIDDSDLVLKTGGMIASLTQSGNFGIDGGTTIAGDFTTQGTITAESLTAERTGSATIFKSGSTAFGDTLDDNHERSGSASITGSWGLNSFDISEISNDTTMGGGSATNTVTENAVKTYIANQTNNFQRYQRKSFAHTGSFISVSTASFAAVTASAPSGFTATSENDFIFFNNGQIMEHDAITIEQSGSEFLVQVNNNSIGYDLKNSDEIVAFGKFDNSYYLDFDGLTNEVTTNFSGSNATPLNKTYSFWYKSTTTGKDRSVFGYGGEKKGAFTPNFNAGRPLMWNGNNWYVYWDDTSAQDDGEWHHWMVFNDVESIVDSKLYVDGTLIDINQTRTTGTISNLQNQTQPLTIGSFRNNSTNAGYHFEGSIREFAVFSGDKTSNASIFYNGGISYDLSDEADLQGYWQMNEGSGTTVADLSGEGNDGTIDGATWDYLV